MDHTLRFNWRGQLVARMRGAGGLVWEDDADGLRLAFADADGVSTSYERDAAGRIVAAEYPRLGRAVFAYNTAGRLEYAPGKPSNAPLAAAKRPATPAAMPAPSAP